MTAPDPLVLAATWGDSPYRVWNLIWRRYGSAGYRLMRDDQELGVAIRQYDSGWYFLAAGHSKGIGGLKSLRACKELLTQNIAVSPWFDDPTATSHMEWSADGVVWQRDERPTPGPWPPDARFYRWVGVGMTHNVVPRAPEAGTS